MTLLIGHDAEVFVTDHGKISSAIGLIGGSKDEPLPVEDGALQEDNVLAELNITPAETEDQFVHRTQKVLDQLRSMLPEGWDLSSAASHEFLMNDIREFGPAAREFGCTPDYNCWTMESNQIADPYTLLRTAGGHVHIGCGQEHRNVVINVMRMCDYMLALPSVLIDDDTRRRQMYGAAGAFRFKPYGGEYRSLSNFWLQDEGLMRWVFRQAQRCYTERDRLSAFTQIITPPELQSIINRGDRARAEVAMADLNITLEL